MLFYAAFHNKDGDFFQQYLLSRLVALTAANTLVFRARPAMGMDNC